MARWGKNIVVPLDSLIKEKENTNRPTAARSAGTVGKWGKMGFTSTRTYALQTIPSEISPGQSPDAATGSTGEGDSSPTREAPKPKKFFKSRNSATILNTQFIQHLPRAPPSPIRDVCPPIGSATPHRDPIKLKIPRTVNRTKSISVERQVKPKKRKKEEKILKPEAPPSRVISRSRKIVNYNEEDEYERSPTPLKDIIVPKERTISKLATTHEPVESCSETTPIPQVEKEPEPPAVVNTTSVIVPTVPTPLPPPVKTPNLEHPPIVLRISKGTSRLVSTDSEDQINSPQHDFQSSNLSNTFAQNTCTSEPHQVSTDSSIAPDEPAEANTIPQSATISPIIPKFVVKPLPALPSTETTLLPPPPPISAPTPIVPDEPDEFNYCTVKISPDKPPKERLKLIIKTDVIRNALAAAAAAAAAAGNNFTSSVAIEKAEKEKKSKNKKHKHLKNIASAKEGDFKTPSPQQSTEIYRTIISPPALSERDFDSQSSVLGSISSKGNSTPLNQALPEEACVIRSRGSSDITSDLETSQHSSLVAPPSDIESRLESMMDGDDVSDTPKEAAIHEEPLQEDILEVLTGGVAASTEDHQPAAEEKPEEPLKRRLKRAGRGMLKEADDFTTAEYVARDSEANAAVLQEIVEEPKTIRRSRRGAQAVQAMQSIQSIQTVQSPPVASTIEPEKSPVISPARRTTRRQNTAATAADTLQAEPETEIPVPDAAVRRGGRLTRNNGLNVNKSPTEIPTPPQPVIRSYSRKRKNPTSASLIGQAPAKQPTLPEEEDVEIASPVKSTCFLNNPLPSETPTDVVPIAATEPINMEVTRPPETTQRRDYKIKEKFKRTWLERDARDQQEAAEKAAAEQLAQSEASKMKQNESILVEKQPTAMKLVISKKKGSIFKSRVADQYPKRHLYKHRWDEQLNGEQSADDSNPNDMPSSAKSGDNVFDDFNPEDDDALETNQSKLTRVVKQTYGANKFDEEPITSVRCERKAKEYYTVVRNVKTAHQIQEFGEYQEINDDVDYFLEALQPHNQISTRCLSALRLASKCMTPAFRMHVRAHGVVTKFFKALSDAHSDLSLGLCTSAIMFILAQDALNMDLDRDSLELMMNLLEVDAKNSGSAAEIAGYKRNKKTVKELCEEIKGQGKATHLNMETISSGTLAMETLLSLTSKRAGEWFKEELRNLGGVEHIIKVICDCYRDATICKSNSIDWTPQKLENIKTIQRCMRVLENVSEFNEGNQHFIVCFNNGEGMDVLFKFCKMCDRELCLHPTSDFTSKDNPGVILREALIPTLQVLINLTHPFGTDSEGSVLLGQKTEIFETSFHILLQTPNYIPDRCVFELSILVLLLLINLTAHTIANRTAIMQAMIPPNINSITERVPAIKVLLEYFYKCEELARLVEKNTDAFLENSEQKNKQEDVDETVNNLLQKAGHHMEHSLKGSYAGILIGNLIKDSEANEKVIRTYLRGNGFSEIIGVLEKYYTFMNLTASSEVTVVSHIKSTKKIIDYFKKRDLMNEAEATSPSPAKFNDSESTPPSPAPTINTRSTQRVYKTYSQR